MSRAAGVPDPSPARLADPSANGQSAGRRRLDIDELTWVDIADIVWLASAIRPASPEHDRPGQEERPPSVPPPEPEPTGSAPPAESLPEPAPPEKKREPARSPDTEIPPEPGNRIRPGGEALVPVSESPDSLGFFRALRPLKRMVRSHRDGAVRLDEAATADWMAQTKMWWPVTRPIRERWLDLTVVLDNGPSMALWRAQVTTFVTLLGRLGAFRSIQVRLLETAGPGEPVLRGGTAGTPAREPAEMHDHSGRRTLILLTDAVGEAWRRGAVLPILALWGRRMPVSVIHLLPQHLWRRCGMAYGRGLHNARLGVPAPLRPNNRWTLELPDAWAEPDPSSLAPPGTVPVPVLEAQPRWLSWWARLLTGSGGEPLRSTVLLAEDSPPVPEPPGDSPPQAAEVVKRFRSLASPPALRLATLLAALPVHPEVVNFVRQRLSADNAVLVELFLNDLLRYAPARGDDESTWDTRAFVFPQAVRQQLLNGARRSETAGVVRAAAAHLGERIPVLGHLRDAIADPHNTPDPVPTPENEADVALEGAIMRALSGPYLSRADRLRNAARSAHPALGSIKPSPEQPDTASDDMHEPAERLSEAVRSTTSLRPAPDGYPTPQESEPPGDRPGYAAGVFTTHERRLEDPPPVWGNVPPRNPNFTGRTELLDQLGKRLTAGGTTAVLPAALHGMGGIGKTQIATEYIYRHLQDYDVIWWIEAARQTQIRASLTELARELGVGGGGDANSAVRAAREALRTGRPYRRWLLVFDAADSPDEVRTFFPTNGPGAVLITSRNPEWAGVSRPLELTVFRREESIELLRKRGPEIDTADANRLAEKLGDLPLAIEQAAAWRAVTGMPVREYLRLFDESVSEILDTSTPPDYEVSVAAAWNVSFDELKTRNPAAHQMLHICAFLSPEPISRDLFTGVSRVSISPELDAALRDPIKLARAIRDINRYSLAKIDHGNNTLQLHRLVQLVLRNRVVAPHLQARMRHGAHQLLASLDPNDPESSRHWPRYRALLPHAYASDVVSCDDGWVRQLVINLMRYLFQWGDHEEAANLASRANAVFEDKLGPADPQTLDVAQRLGLYLWGLGRYDEAARINQLTLQRRIQESGEENEELFALQTNIVIDYRAQGDFAGAKKLSEEIYQKSQRLFGDDDPETLNAAFQHALSLRLSGEYQAAAKLDEDTLRRRIEVLGPDHPKTIGVNAGLIIDRREAGEYTRARIEQEKLAEFARSRLGEDKPNFMAHLNLLSIARRKDGDHERAFGLSREAYERFILVYGPDNPTTVACALAHSIDARHSGDLTAAKKLGEQTFEGYRRSLGEHHPHTLATTVDLAVTLRLRGETAEARELDERAVEQLRAAIGPDHPYTIVATINLASDLAALGETEAALELGRDAIERGNRILGENHPTVLAAAHNLGLDLVTAGRPEEAEQYQEPILSRYRKVLGEAHPATTAAAQGIRANCDIDPMGM
ncbi:FxSxx-COOH system tetratricopeptide repeat protein [Amycolatopsis pigmentata]|uniref:FxSxx-COOH system tetratricopeptide repeat protein n=1 Tax=Amycolatopsis pigmentata TaxID=450801 RepID=A0ABW5FPY4_9PSEU